MAVQKIHFQHVHTNSLRTPEFFNIRVQRYHRSQSLPAISFQWGARWFREDSWMALSATPMWPWTVAQPSKNLGFLICKIGIITRYALLVSQGYYDNQVRKQMWKCLATTKQGLSASYCYLAKLPSEWPRNLEVFYSNVLEDLNHTLIWKELR